jgi:hypothetical protein
MGGWVSRRVVGLGRRVASHAARLTPTRLGERHREGGQRRTTERLLAQLSASPARPGGRHVLVDAMYDNPNYWVRYALLRAALGLAGDRELGVLGPHRARPCRRTLRRLGIGDAVRITELHDDRARHRRHAEELLARARTPDDVLGWTLPGGVPADFLYDGLLKRQRAAEVDVRDPRLTRYVADALASIAAADRLLGSRGFDLVVLSHAVNVQFAALAWLATSRGIPVVLAQGHYGVPRFVKLLTPMDVYDTNDRPTAADADALPPHRAEVLAAAGRAYLDKRLAGGTDDLGARYAFQRASRGVTRQAVVERFGWDPERPIIGVYASNWFDFPHGCGMTQFRDFLDWMRATLEVAAANRHVNWLFKGHPCDDWYGGVTLSDLVPPLDAHAHVRLVPGEWNGAALLHALDGVVTVHGTAGIEYAAAGKPVLVADRGWYHDFGFVRWPRSRGEYLQALATDWWKDLDLHATTRRARVFAGWYFTRPRWQGGFVLEDDPRQGAIYRTAPTLLTADPDAVRREIRTIREWYASDHRHYHTYKMSQATDLAY